MTLHKKFLGAEGDRHYFNSDMSPNGCQFQQVYAHKMMCSPLENIQPEKIMCGETSIHVYQH